MVPLNIYDWACWARQITEAGRREMLDWARELLSTPEPEHPKFAAGLSVQMILPPDEVNGLLRARLGRLEESIAARRAAITGHLREVSLRVPKTYATRRYSWMTAPARSCRWTRK